LNVREYEEVCPFGGTMRSSIQLLEEIIRDLTAMHLKLVNHRNAGRNIIGGMSVDQMLAEIDAGIRSRDHMLACFKAELAALEAALHEREASPRDLS
jgi:hypothetical protein